MSELDDEARQLLSLARSARTPDANDRARVARRLGLVTGAVIGAASATAMAQASSAAVKAGAASAAWKLGAVGVAVFSAALGGYLTFKSPAASPARPESTPPTAAPRVPTPASRVSSDAPNVLDAPVRTATPLPRRADRAAPHPDTLAQELDLLHEAQAAWRARQAARALELVQRHRQRFPRTQLRDEREALEVLTLCELGRTREAQSIVRALLKRAPQSPSRAAIEESCALE